MFVQQYRSCSRVLCCSRVFFWLVVAVLLCVTFSVLNELRYLPFLVTVQASLLLADLPSSQDVLSNFFGGLMLLLAEPFIPGDMVTFQRGGVR